MNRLAILRRACLGIKHRAVAHASGMNSGGFCNLITGRRRITDFQWTKLRTGLNALGIPMIDDDQSNPQKTAGDSHC